MRLTFARVAVRGLNAALLVLSAAAAHAQNDAPYRAVEEILRTSETVIGEPLAYPANGAEIRALIVTLAPGEATAWHTHPVPLVGYILEGELTVEYQGHFTRVYRQGEALLEAMGAVHQGRNAGSEPCRILAVYLGGDGKPLTEAR